MAIFDSLLSKFSAVKEARATEAAAKEEQRRAAAEQAELAATALFAQLEAGKGSNTPLFSRSPMDETVIFTQEFSKRLLLPASSLQSCRLKMFPFSEDRLSRRELLKIFPQIANGEAVLFSLDNKGVGEHLVVTLENLFLKRQLPQFPGYFYQIKFPLHNIETMTVEETEGLGRILCNGVVLTEISRTVKSTEIVSLAHYFRCLETCDFEISEQEVHNLICEKIGEEACKTIAKYIAEDEKIVYFAWGLDSLTAKDFLMCTTQQFIHLDRELLGAAQNIKRLDYEDINSMQVTQQNNGSLTATLLNAALNLCDLTVYTAGTNIKIQTLSVPEAERVVEIYDFYKRQIKAEAKQPAAITISPDPLEQLAKLQNLKDTGVLTEEEYAAKKAELLAKI